MKTNIETTIHAEIDSHKTAIAESEREISRLKKMLDIYKQSDTIKPFSEGGVPEKRKYTKRKHKSDRKKLSPSLRRISWKKVILATIKQKGRPMKSKELIDVLFKGRHSSTMKVLKRRISVILTLYKNDGTLKTNKNGRGLKYGLPEMFTNK